jgi:hypothetical protein
MKYEYKGKSITLIPVGNWYNVVIDDDNLLESFQDSWAAKAAAQDLVDMMS